MRQKMLNQVTMLLFSSVIITFLVVSLAMYDKFSGYMRANVREEAEYICVALEESEDGRLIEKIGEKEESSRITFLDQYGNVLYDSMGTVNTMDNHRNRPEIEDAVTYGSGEIVRFSDTLSKQTFYYAVKLDDGRILRMSQSIDTVLIFLKSSITLMGILVFAIVLAAFFIIWKQTAKWVDPLNRLDLEHPLKNVEYEELRPLLVRVHEQKKQIQAQMREMKERHEEYLAITENMKDGLVITSQTEVLSINKAAQEFFQIHVDDCVRKPIGRISDNPQLQKVITQALEGKYNEHVLKIHDKTYQLLANPVNVLGKVHGAVILIWDITEKSQAEEMRKEFSANVSHELKTPLMSISGYAELIENNMVSSEDIPEFAGRIHQEANRLSALVADIIQLSRLEESDQELPRTEVDIYEMTKEIRDKLETEAADKQIHISIEGESTVIRGVSYVLYEMFYNLMDNGIKYNKCGGTVRIHISGNENYVEWMIRDSGIGIEKEHLERIYERFYRVDKSHSRQTGGTGLGLSIVKHGAAVHNAVIKTESIIDEGTMITIRFPLNER